jgi:hypothetical protein
MSASDYLVVTPQAVRDYLGLQNDGQSRYTDATVSSNIRTAQSKLEQETHRFLINHPAIEWVCPATMIRAQVPIPGFRTFSSVVWGGSTLTIGFHSYDSASCWAIPDTLMTGTYVAVQFRAWRADSDAPWWLADPQWYDKLLDSPFYPGNRGGGYAWTSMPDDLVINGDAGWEPGTEPDVFLHAVKVLAGWYIQRSPAILTDVTVRPSGNVPYSMLPPEAQDFIADFKIGQQVVSVG